MELKLHQYILQLIKKAHYEYDPSVKAWVGWVEGFRGIYAQHKTVEDVRADLISTLEDFLLLGLKRGVAIPGFFSRPKRHAKAR